MKTMKQATRTRKGQFLNIKMWFGGAKQSCSVSTLKSLIRNMINGTISVRRLNCFEGTLNGGLSLDLCSLVSIY